MGPRTRNLLVALLVLALVGSTVVAVSGATSDPSQSVTAKKKKKKKKKKGFTPKTLAGKWTGTWTNTTSANTGALRADIASIGGGKQMQITLDFGGIVFACSDPAPESITLSKGNGDNRWNSKGFHVKTTSDLLGALDITYTLKDKVLKGSGISKKCLPAGVAWSLSNGKISGKSLSSDLSINGVGFSNSGKLSATR